MPQNAGMSEFGGHAYPTREDVLAHIQNSQPGELREKFQCEICLAWLGSRHTLKTHRQNHSSERKKCPYCDKTSPTQNALQIHIRGVEYLDPYIYIHNSNTHSY